MVQGNFGVANQISIWLKNSSSGFSLTRTSTGNSVRAIPSHCSVITYLQVAQRFDCLAVTLVSHSCTNPVHVIQLDHHLLAWGCRSSTEPSLCLPDGRDLGARAGMPVTDCTAWHAFGV